jgi:hypothetical protein
MVNYENIEREGTKISKAESLTDLVDTLRGMVSIQGDDGKMYDAKDIEHSISIIVKNANQGKAILVDLPTEELNQTVLKLLASRNKVEKPIK